MHDWPVIPGYRLLEKLGEGVVGSVYRARPDNVGAGGADVADVAIKLFPSSSSWVLDEFRRESSVLRRRHPNLVVLLDAGVVGGRPYLVMEYVPGEDVRARMMREVPAPEEVVALMAVVFRGLDCLHRAGLIHGDVKPENIRLHGEEIRLVDMGRAQLQQEQEAGESFPGTPPYMLPSLHHKKAPSVRSDCFAAWVMFYEMINLHRPFLAEDLAIFTDHNLPPRAPLCWIELEPLVEAGLSGRVVGARMAEVLLLRFLHEGIVEMPSVPMVNPLPPTVHSQIRLQMREMRSMALVGSEESGRQALEQLQQDRRSSGQTLWARPEWAPTGTPLAGALSLVVQASLAFSTERLQEMAREMGAQGQVLAEVVPAARAWLARDPRGVPTAAQVRLALLRMIEVCPKPLLILVAGLDRLDGASRRMLTELALSPDLRVVGTSRTRNHGMPSELVLDDAGAAPWEGEPERLTPDDREVLVAAAALELPLNAVLQRAVGIDAPTMARVARAAEVAGLVEWDGQEVVLKVRLPVSAAQMKRWAGEAAARLDPQEEPLLVARYARLAQDPARLADVLDLAVARASVFDPGLALELLDQQTGACTTAELLRRFDLAIQGRAIERARAVLDQILRQAGPKDVIEVAEAEMELHFQEGRITEALEVGHRAMAALRLPLPTGFMAQMMDLRAFLQLLWRSRRSIEESTPPSPPSPPTYLPIIARLHDLHFLSDNLLMMHIHRLWRVAAPQDWRSRAMEVVWYSALGMKGYARSTEERLLTDARVESAGPLAEPIVLAHRGIGRLLRGETRQAFSDAFDASHRLLSMGDAYSAALASTVVWAAGYHLNEASSMRGVADRLARVAELTGDQKARSWVAGGEAVIAWLDGKLAESIELTRRWAETAAQNGDSSGALAHRFLGELYLDECRPEDAMPEFNTALKLMDRYHLFTDHCHAVYLSLGIASGQLRRMGKAPLPGLWRHQPIIRFLLWRSPRWTPRALVAEAWQAGTQKETREKLIAASQEARCLEHARDEAWILEQQEMIWKLERW